MPGIEAVHSCRMPARLGIALGLATVACLSGCAQNLPSGPPNSPNTPAAVPIAGFMTDARPAGLDPTPPS